MGSFSESTSYPLRRELLRTGKSALRVRNIAREPARMHLRLRALGLAASQQVTMALRLGRQLPSPRKAAAVWPRSAPGNRGPRLSSVSVRGVLHEIEKGLGLLQQQIDQDFGKAVAEFI